MRYLLVTYQWRILTRPQVAAFDCPVTDTYGVVLDYTARNLCRSFA